MASGELAAAGTALCWTGSALAFEAAGKRMGSLPLNLVRLVMGFALLSALAVLLGGPAWPGAAAGATAEAWGWLLASGVVGFVLGDLCLFRAYLELGARLTLLVQATAPAITALIGWAALGERLGAVDLAGLAAIAAGVAWAVTGRQEKPAAAGAAPGGRRGVGLLLALGGALGQAGGLVLSKRGLGTLSPVSGTQIRALAGVVGFTLIIVAARRLPQLGRGLADGRALAYAGAGALFGPCIGVSLSLYAVAHAPAGVAAAIMSTTPILVLPVAMARGERVGARGLVGAVVAVAGVALLVTA